MILFLKRIAFLMVFLSMPALAQVIPQWNIVPSASSITFKAIQNNAPVEGTFKGFSGEIRFDPNQLNKSSVTMMIDINSLFTAYQDVGSTLKTTDWLDAKTFPQAIFKSNSFIHTKGNLYLVNGTLTLRDHVLPLSVAFSLDEYTDKRAKISATTIIKRNQFGVGKGEWAKTDVIKNEVQVFITLVAEKK